MLTFVPTKVKAKKQITIQNGDDEIWVAQLPSGTLANKTKLICDELNSITSMLGEDFEKDFIDMIEEFKVQYLSDPIIALIDKYYPAVKDYINKNGYKETQKGHSKLFMTQDEIDVLLSSCVMCKYAILFLSQLDSYHAKQVITKIYEPMIEKDLVKKLLNLIASKITPFRHSDTKMWAFLKLVVSKTPETHTTGLLAFILKSILPICTIDRNPVVYILSVAGECIKWVVHGVYDPPEFSRTIPSSITDISNALDNIISMKMIEYVKHWCISNSSKDIIPLIDRASYTTQFQLLIVKIFKNLFNVSGSIIKRLSPSEIYYICLFMQLGSKMLDEKEKLPDLDIDPNDYKFTFQYNNSYQTATVPIANHPIKLLHRHRALGSLLRLIPYQKRSSSASQSYTSILLHLPLSGIYSHDHLNKMICEIFSDLNSYKYIDLDSGKMCTFNSKTIILDLIALLYQHYKFDIYKLLNPMRSLLVDQNLSSSYDNVDRITAMAF